MISYKSSINFLKKFSQIVVIIVLTSGFIFNTPNLSLNNNSVLAQVVDDGDYSIYDDGDYSLDSDEGTVTDDGDYSSGSDGATIIDDGDYSLDSDGATIIDDGDYPLSTPSCPFEFKYSECTWTGPGIVQEVLQDCNGNYKVGRTLFQSGVCGDTTRASQPQPTPTPVAACDFKLVNTECDNSGPGFVHDVFINCMNNVRFRNVRFVRGTCGDVVAAPTPIPPVVINPTPVQGGTVVTADQRCPSGTDFGGIVGSNIICIQQTQNQNQVVTNNATASTGAVNINLTGGSAARTATTPVSGQTIVTSVPGKTFVSADTELPKTGVPLVAWAFPGLLPLGLRLRKFGSFKGATKNLGSFFWQKREFDK